MLLTYSLDLQMEKKKPSRIRVNTSFAIMPDILRDAKELCWQKRISFSSQMEILVKEWVIKNTPKEKQNKKAPAK